MDPTKKMFVWSGVLTKHNLYMLAHILPCKHQIRKHLFDALVFVLGLIYPSLPLSHLSLSLSLSLSAMQLGLAVG